MEAFGCEYSYEEMGLPPRDADGEQARVGGIDEVG